MHTNAFATSYDPSASILRFQEQMAKRGNIESQFKLGLMHETGTWVKPNTKTALTWYKKAASKNHKPALNRITYLEIKRAGFKKSHIEWLKSLKDDARHKEGEALFLLGQMYSAGIGVNKSLTRSLKLLRRAEGKNITGAENEIKRIELELSVLRKEYAEKQAKSAILIVKKNKKNTAITAKPPVTTKIVKPTVFKKTPKTKPTPVIKRPLIVKKPVSRLANKKQKVKTNKLNPKMLVIQKPLQDEYEHPMVAVINLAKAAGK